MFYKSLKILFLILCMVFGMPEAPARAAEGGEVVDGIIAIVGAQIITRSDIQSLRQQLNMAGMAEAMYGQAVQADMDDAALLEMLVEEKLIEHAIDQIGIQVSDAEVETTINRILSRNQMNRDQLIVMLRREGMDYERYKENVRSRLKSDRFRAQFIAPYVQVSEERVQRLMRQDDAGPKWVVLTFIVLTPSEVEMWQSLSRDHRGRRFDEFPFAGGRTPFSGKLTDLAPEVTRHLKDKPEGYITDVVTVGGQAAVIRVENVSESAEAHTDAYQRKMNELHGQLMQEEYKKYMAQWVRDQKHQLRVEYIDLPK